MGSQPKSTANTLTDLRKQMRGILRSQQNYQENYYS